MKRRTRKIDLTGRTFGRLTVLREAGRCPHSGSVMWLCRCKCGKETVVRSNVLLEGKTRSCGCLAEEMEVIKEPYYVPYEGEWITLKEAVNRTGIKKPTLWARIQKGGDPKDWFRPPHKRLKDGTKGPLMIEYKGLRLTIGGWSKRTGLRASLLYARYYQGLRGKMLFVVPAPRIKVEYGGREWTVLELSKATGISKSVLYARIDAGDRDERLVRPVDARYSKRMRGL